MWTAARRLYGSLPCARNKRAGLSRNQPPTRGRPDFTKMELECDKGSEKIRNVPGAAKAPAQGDRRARGQSTGGNSQRRTFAQEHAQSARSGMAGPGDSSLGSRSAARASRAEIRAAMSRG